MKITNIQIPAVVIHTKKAIELYIKNKLITLDIEKPSYKVNENVKHPTKGQNLDIII